MNLRKKFLTACLMGTAVIGLSTSAEAQITTTTNRLKLVNGANSLLLLPPTGGGADTLTFPQLNTGSQFVVTNPASPQTITGGITINGGLTLGTALSVPNGGTGATTLASNGVLYGNGAGAVQALAVNATGNAMVLTQVSSGAPTWSDGSGNFILNGTSAQTNSDFNIDGDGTIGGTATVTGPASLNGGANVAGADFTVGTNKFIVDDATGDVNFFSSGVTGSSITKTGGANLTINTTGGDLILTGDDMTVSTTTSTFTNTASFNGNVNLGNAGGDAITVNGAATFTSTAAHGTNLVSGSNFDINGGAIDGTPIGASAASTGAFTTLSTSGLATLASAAVTGNAALNGTVGLGDNAADAITLTGTLTGAGAGHSLGTLATNANVLTINGLNGGAKEVQVNGDVDITGTLTAGTLDLTSPLGVADGGTGLDASTVTDGQLLIGNGTNSDFDLATITGTSDRVDVTNGAGSITLDIANTYEGQASIITVGTVTTGSWTATPVADTYVANDLTIDGGTIDDSPIGATTPNTGKFTTLETTGLATLGASATVTGTTTTDKLAGSFTGRYAFPGPAATSYVISNSAIVAATSTVTATFVDVTAPFESYIIVVSDIVDGAFTVELPDVPSAGQSIMYTITN